MARPSRIRATVIVASFATGIGVWIWRAPEPQPLRRFAIPSPSGAPPLEASISFSEADLDYWMVELGPRGLAEAVTATPRPFLRQSRRQHDLEISPDGRFAAYISAEGGIFAGFVTRFPSAEGKWELPILTRIPSGGLTGNGTSSSNRTGADRRSAQNSRYFRGHFARDGTIDKLLASCVP